jgi:hypothetical protein
MSNLLEQASLVMIPSGYKEDVVYSEIPIDGSGDLQFTRSSNGTRINSAGLVEDCPWNLLEYSEDLSNAIWGNDAGNTKISNTTTAPNGTTTADTISAISGNVMNVYQIIQTNDGTLSYSVYLKKNATNLISIYIYQTFGSTGFKALGEINFDNGTFTASVGTGTIESVGNGWFRVTLTATLLSGANSFGIYTTSDTGTRNVYLWGAQLNIGSTAKPYFPTTDRLDVPRLTYQNGGGGCPSLLLEKQSTNLLSYSQDFTNAYWSKLNQGIGDVAVVTANYAISPDGTQNATRFVCNLNGGTTSSDRSWMIASFTAPATSTISIWIKLNSAGTKTFVFSDSGGGTKTISGTDWQRIDGTFVGAGGEYRIGLIGGSSSDTLDCCIWGAQAESGSYPTSYIPTTSSSATRVADACSKTGISSLIGQTEGVLFADFNFEQKPDTNGNIVILLRGSSSEAYIYLTSSTVQADFISGAIQCSIVGSIGAVGRKKIAFAYKQNDFALYMNGVQIGTDSSGTVGSLTALTVGSYDSPGYLLNSGINQAVLFPTRLTNAELASLTTI